MAKCLFGLQEIDFLGQKIATERLAPQKHKATQFLEKAKFPGSKRTCQRYIGFLNYYQKYIPRFAERFTAFLQRIKTMDAEAKNPISTYRKN